MKFRSVIREAQCMREFLNIVQMLAKLAKDCVLHLTAEQVHFIVNESSSTAPLVWVSIDASCYFAEYLLKGVSESRPQIMLSVSATFLSRAFTELRQQSRYCKIKLSKTQFPCLSIETMVKSPNSDISRAIFHEVPVTVLPLSEWKLYALPKIPKCQVVLNVPSIRFMKGLIDKIKNLSPSVIFYVTSKGEMNLVAETDLATISTRFRRLELRTVVANEDNGSRHVEVSCSVDCRKTAMFFSALQVPTMEISCGIDDSHLIHLETNVRRGVVIHSLLPAVCI